MRKPIAIASAAVAVAAGLLVPAQASAAPPSIDTAAATPFAVWRDTNFSGPGGSMNDHVFAYGTRTYPGTSIRIDNSASSAANYAPDFVVMAFRDPQRSCDRTAVFLLFLQKGQQTATASWQYPNLAAKGFDNTISGHCFHSQP